MLTKYTLFHSDGLQDHFETDLPEEPTYDELARIINPLVKGELEHITVLYEDKPHDMFVNERGYTLHMPRNEEATKIYRTDWLTQNPKADPELIGYISGPAVLFYRIVWT